MNPSPLANDLNDAGVYDWMERLRDARARDVQEYKKGVTRNITHYDREWIAVKSEYRQAMVKRESA